MKKLSKTEAQLKKSLAFWSSKKIDEVDFNIHPIPLDIFMPLHIISNK